MSKIEKFITTTCEITLSPEQIEHILKQYLRDRGAIPDKSFVVVTTEGLDRLNGIKFKTVQNDSAICELELK